MKKLHTFSLWESPQAGMFKEMLAQEGISCLVKNDRLSSAIGEIPFIECFPELWVIDDEAYPRAHLLLDAWLTPYNNPQAEEPWICPVCGESSEPQFSICWNCSRPRE
ncbi:MAG: DUF2007 domain-containing protein [Deltaproteobacteria bacterium]|nr:DUF2007 domain-containing protein [Deltaproteobacteria bacterium]